jgi:predicted transposase/invertase (TIGR01784 family)
LTNELFCCRSRGKDGSGSHFHRLQWRESLIGSHPLKTDSLFYRIFQTDPGILFELLGQSPRLAQGYEFKSVEIKQVAFRIDGVFLPTPESPDQTVWFVEVQFQQDPQFYQRFFSEIYLYLGLHPQTVDWRTAVIYPHRRIEPTNPHVYRANLDSNQVHRIYLEDLDKPSNSLGVGLMQLIVADSTATVTQAQGLLSRARSRDQTSSKNAAIIELNQRTPPQADGVWKQTCSRT